jgi:hypothetical protein
MDKIGKLEKANASLAKLYGAKHQALTLDDIEKVYKRNLLSVEADTKTIKGSASGFMTGIQYLAPAKVSGFNTCPAASKGCEQACLFTAGRGVFYSVFRARVAKTLAYYFDSARYLETLDRSIESLKRKAKRRNMTPIVRLNGTSDILWEKTFLMAKHSDIQFYDYTKIAGRFKTELPQNYDLTFSLHETNKRQAMQIAQNGGRVAIVFRKDLPKSFWGIAVNNGDKTDLRFLDPKNCIVGLKAKGKARKDVSGFVQDVAIAPRMTQRFILNTINVRAYA